MQISMFYYKIHISQECTSQESSGNVQTELTLRTNQSFEQWSFGVDGLGSVKACQMQLDSNNYELHFMECG